MEVDMAPPQKIPVVGSTLAAETMELVFTSRSVSLIEEDRKRMEALALCSATRNNKAMRTTRLIGMADSRRQLRLRDPTPLQNGRDDSDVRHLDHALDRRPPDV